MTHPPQDGRPRLHFTAPENWLNDPNGIIFWEDRYHLFYQHNPHAPVWSRPYWGHATSSDLVNWVHQPIALRPDQPYDSAGCYSGSCVDDNGTPTILYTAVRDDGTGALIETVGLATGDHTLATWIKHSEPVIGAPPPGFGSTGFRDPFVWKHDDGDWRMILGSSSRTQGAAVLLYSSPDLRAWRYLGVLISQHDIPHGRADAALWECPQLVRLEGGDVLLLSRHDRSPLDVIMITGRLHDTTFEPLHSAVMDEGPSWYAPHTFTTAQDRHLVFGWLREDPADTTQTEAGWAGVLSLPREIYLGNEGFAATRPAAEIARLHRSPRRLTATDAGDVLDLELPSAQTEVHVRFATADQLSLVAPPHTVISTNGDELSITIEWPPTEPVATDGRDGDQDRSVPGDRLPGEASSVQLHIIIDGTIVETFLDNARARAFRAYPWHLQFRRLRVRTSHPSLRAAQVSLQSLGSLTPLGGPRWREPEQQVNRHADDPSKATADIARGAG